MLLAIDIGNTNTVFAIFQNDGLLKSWRCQTENMRPSDEYASFLGPLLQMQDLNFTHIQDVIISSVVPEANRHVRGFCEGYLQQSPVFVAKDLIDIDVDLDRPEDVGADRLVNALSVITHYQTPAIVIDFGTATTFDVIDSGPVYRGGAIAPGINLSIAALHSAASKLPKVSIKKPDQAIGKTTVEAMQSGVYWGYIGLIREIVSRLSTDISGKPIVIATGGLAPVFADDLDVVDKIDDDLNIKGLHTIYQSRQG